MRTLQIRQKFLNYPPCLQRKPLNLCGLLFQTHFTPLKSMDRALKLVLFLDDTKGHIAKRSLLTADPSTWLNSVFHFFVFSSSDSLYTYKDIWEYMLGRGFFFLLNMFTPQFFNSSIFKDKLKV